MDLSRQINIFGTDLLQSILTLQWCGVSRNVSNIQVRNNPTYPTLESKSTKSILSATVHTHWMKTEPTE